MLSLSTSWNHTPETNMEDWLSAVEDIGFQAVELGYTLTRVQLDQLVPLLKERGVRVTSIHNFCPIPDDGPSPRHPSNYYRLSALEALERQKAVEWTKKTIDLAVHVKAGVVIIHAGTLELKNDPSEKLFDLFKQGKNFTPEFRKQVEKLKKIREENKRPFIEALESSLREVMDYAQKKKMKIGLETRYYPIEIPNFEEVAYFLKLFGSQGMGYWHDIGHGEVNERLGLVSHMDFLHAYRRQLIGMHVHGIQQLRDHLAPFKGDMDLMPFLSFLKENMIKVVEARYATADEIRAAFAKLA